mgnify:CR=1 FL=1
MQKLPGVLPGGLLWDLGLLEIPRRIQVLVGSSVVDGGASVILGLLVVFRCQLFLSRLDEFGGRRAELRLLGVQLRCPTPLARLFEKVDRLGDAPRRVVRLGGLRPRLGFREVLRCLGVASDLLQEVRRLDVVALGHRLAQFLLLLGRQLLALRGDGRSQHRFVLPATDVADHEVGGEDDDHRAGSEHVGQDLGRRCRPGGGPRDVECSPRLQDQWHDKRHVHQKSTFTPAHPAPGAAPRFGAILAFLEPSPLEAKW